MNDDERIVNEYYKKYRTIIKSLDNYVSNESLINRIKEFCDFNLEYCEVAEFLVENLISLRSDLTVGEKIHYLTIPKTVIFLANVFPEYKELFFYASVFYMGNNNLIKFLRLYPEFIDKVLEDNVPYVDRSELLSMK